MRKALVTLSLLLAFTLVLSACNLPRPTPTGEAGPNLANTYAAETVAALSTQFAANPVTNTPPPVVETTEAPTQQPTEETPTAQVETTQAPVASTAEASITPTAQACDRVRFIRDVTIPDGTGLVAGSTFTKVWELENAGSCTWNSNYSLVFANEGNAMGGPASKLLTTGTVAPGQRIQVSIDLVAPTAPGTHRGYWKLRNASGTQFGVGPEDKPFYVEIKVTGDLGSGPNYSLIDFYCSAEWRSGAGVLSCPGRTNDSGGFVLQVSNPRFETGATDDEPALWTNPQLVENGEIRGTFPAIRVATGSHFRTVIGCLYNATNCNVKFSVAYRIDGGAEQVLGEWTETYDESFTKVDLDLSSLAGKSVQFILIVRANGPSNQDQAFWLLPRVGP